MSDNNRAALLPSNSSTLSVHYMKPIRDSAKDSKGFMLYTVTITECWRIWLRSINISVTSWSLRTRYTAAAAVVLLLWWWWWWWCYVVTMPDNLLYNTVYAIHVHVLTKLYCIDFNNIGLYFCTKSVQASWKKIQVICTRHGLLSTMNSR